MEYSWQTHLTWGIRVDEAYNVTLHRKYICILTKASGDSTSLGSCLEDTLECRTFMLKGTLEVRESNILVLYQRRKLRLTRYTWPQNFLSSSQICRAGYNQSFSLILSLKWIKGSLFCHPNVTLRVAVLEAGGESRGRVFSRRPRA